MVASETGHVYTFATPKLQPLITKAEGKNLIQSCLNSPDVNPTATVNSPPTQQHHINRGGYDAPIYPTSDGLSYDDEEKKNALMRMKDSTMPNNMNYANVGGMHRPMQNSGLAVPHSMPYMYQPPHHYGNQQFPPQYAQIKNQPYVPMHSQHSHNDEHAHHGSHQDQ